jgi:hypothetical protein
MINCSCGSTYLRKNKGQHRNSNKHKCWLRDERWAQSLNRELDQLIVNANTIQPPMEAPKVENDLENKEPLIIESPIKLPERVNLNIHCNRCHELKTSLQIIGISLGVTSFVLVIWLITGK